MEKFIEDGRYDFLPLPCSRYPIRGGLQAPDDGGGTNIPCLSETVGPVTRIYSRPGGRFASSAPSNSARRWSSHTVGDPHPSPRGVSSEVSGVLFEFGGTAVVPVQGVPGQGGNVDGVMHALFALLCARHHNHRGGGKPTTPMVNPLWNACDMGGPK